VDFSDQQKDDIIRWHAEGIKEAILGGRSYLRKIRYGDGTVVGLAGWVVERDPKERANTNTDKTTAEAMKGGNEQRSPSWLPGALDVTAWLKVSANLNRERYRVIGNLDNVCRTSDRPRFDELRLRLMRDYAIGLTIMSIRPDCQRRGLGSRLVQYICEDMDRHSRHGYALASPAGIRLYSKFGFETVGQVDTSHGTITSMLRRRRVRAFESHHPKSK
jgi:GNAT superfamily N-acetyltransferase